MEEKNLISKIPSMVFPELSDRENKFSCSDCSLRFKFEKDLMLHVDPGCHAFRCSVCESTFRTKIGMAQHFGKKHSSTKACRCTLCHKKFKSIYILRNHKKQVHFHSTMKVCPHCNKNLFNTFSLSRHTKVCEKRNPSIVIK